MNKIQTNGYDVAKAIPIIRMPNGNLVQFGGHHRAEAMRRLGEKTIPGRIVDWDSLSLKVQQWWRHHFPHFFWDDFIR